MEPHEPPPAAPGAGHAPGGRLRRIGFRLLFAYLVLYIPTFPLTVVPVIGTLARAWERVWAAVVPWVGERLIGLGEITVPAAATGSGDTTYFYVKLLCQLVLAAAIAGVWSAVRPAAGGDAIAHARLRVAVRYHLATAMVAYGTFKVFNTQFPAPGLERLIQRYGDSSPMGLMWTFMGHSNAYATLSGILEVLAAALLFFRRTTTLGALLAFAVMANVVALDFGYDVPVRLIALHLLLMAAALAAPDLRRLADVLVLQRPTTPPRPVEPWPVWMKWPRLVLKTAFVSTLLVLQVGQGWIRLEHDRNSRPPLYGLYEARTFTRNGETLPPLITDGRRWHWFVIERHSRVFIQPMSGPRRQYWMRHDAAARTVTLLDWDSRGPVAVLAYAETGPGRLVVSGAVDGAQLAVELQRVPESSFLLVNRGFQWIRESSLLQ